MCRSPVLHSVRRPLSLRVAVLLYMVALCACGGRSDLNVAGAGSAAPLPPASAGSGLGSGPGATCVSDPTVIDCPRADGYTCPVSGLGPNAYFPNVICAWNTPNVPGPEQNFCCFNAPEFNAPPGTCAFDSFIVYKCPKPNSFGFSSCLPADTPTTYDPGLRCEPLLQTPGAFCCTLGP
jgi:hypothetical protein